MTSASLQPEPAAPAVAFIAQGRLFLHEPRRDKPRALDSYFAEQIRQRQQRQQTSGGWRGGNPIWTSMQIPAAWYGLGQTTAIADQARAVFGDVSGCGRGMTMLYMLHTQAMSGLFEYSPQTDEERRLIHQQNLFLRDPRRHPSLDMLACCVEMEDGTAHLAVGDGEGRKRKLVTEGDCRDEAPSWARDGSARLIYQSAGVGRDQHGHYTGLGPYRAEMIDLDASRVTTLLESADEDYLAPQLGADGTLYAIARPYEPFGRRAWWTTLKTALLFPWHLILTLVMLVNAMSMIFRGKPAVDAPATPMRANPVAVMLYGRLLQAKRSARNDRKPRAPLAPADWRLVAVAKDGRHQTLADHVVCFDLACGGVVYSDGFRVYFRNHGGTVIELCRGDLIERLAALDG